jgi:hypothetical protein
MLRAPYGVRYGDATAMHPIRDGIRLEGIFIVNARTRPEPQIQPCTGGLFQEWCEEIDGLTRRSGIRG